MAPSPPFDIATTIQSGSVYYFSNNKFDNLIPHYYVVLNNDPQNEPLLVLVCASSQVQKVREKRQLLRPDTVVEISPSEYPSFTVQSIVDCNSIHERTVQQLQTQYDNGNLRVEPIMAAAIVDRLRDAVLESDLVEREIHDILVG